MVLLKQSLNLMQPNGIKKNIFQPINTKKLLI